MSSIENLVAEKIAIQREEEVAKINRGHVIAIDIDSGDILSSHSPIFFGGRDS